MSKLTPHCGMTRSGEATAELLDSKTLVLKAYANTDGSKLRIVLPELVNMRQTLISPDNHFIEFTRASDGH
jgi:hypothetical protein